MSTPFTIESWLKSAGLTYSKVKVKIDAKHTPENGIAFLFFVGSSAFKIWRNVKRSSGLEGIRDHKSTPPYSVQADCGPIQDFFVDEVQNHLMSLLPRQKLIKVISKTQVCLSVMPANHEAHEYPVLLSQECAALAIQHQLPVHFSDKYTNGGFTFYPPKHYL